MPAFLAPREALPTETPGWEPQPALESVDALPTVDWAEMGVPRPPQPVLRDDRRAGGPSVTPLGR